MTFSWILLVVVSFHLVISTNQNCDSSYFVKNFSEVKSLLKKLICTSEGDDDVASTRNHDPTENYESDRFGEFKHFFRKQRKSCPPGCTFSQRVNGSKAGCRCRRSQSENIEENCWKLVLESRRIRIVEQENSMDCIKLGQISVLKIWEEKRQLRLKTIVLPVERSLLKFTSLKPYTKYIIQIILTNGTIVFFKDVMTLEEAPDAVQNLTLEDHSPYEVTGYWKPPIHENGMIRNYTVMIEKTELFGCKELGKKSPKSSLSINVTTTVASFRDLHPYAEYKFTVVANTIEAGPAVSEIIEMKSLVNPTSKIKNLHLLSDVNGIHIAWEAPEDCTTITGPTRTKKLIFDCSNRSKNSTFFHQTEGFNFTLAKEELPFYTRCRVRVYIIRGFNKTVNESNYQELNFTIPPTALSAVQNLTIYEADAANNIISVKWIPPNPPNDEIEFYKLLLWNDNSLIENKSIGIFELNNCTPPYVCVENFHFQSNISGNTKLKLQVFAINIGVAETGIETSYNFTLNDLYYKYGRNPSQEKTLLIWLIIIPILVIWGLITFIWYRKRGKTWWLLRRERDPLIVSTMGFPDHCPRTDLQMITEPENREHQLSTEDNNKVDLIPCNPHFDPVRVEELEKYIKEALTSGSLASQWKMLPDPQSTSQISKYGNLPENMSKNQRNHVIPYDNNRVVLEKLAEDSYSDYINASYIQGYQKVKAYIATQGPKVDKNTDTDTIVDFWRMVWQEDVRVICMVTNVVEDGQKKCDQYWPEVGKNVEYGDNFVLNLEHEVFTDYTIRTLQLMCRGGRREIKHFHYTAWPEHGVPMFTQSLASFMKKLLATPVGKGPIVVHGSLGVGRTGTLISCDICLRQAVKERVIDIPTVTRKIRRDRANMVETVQQYLLAHLVIAECKILEQTQAPCTKQLKEKINKLRKKLPSDVRRLSEIVWLDRALHSLATKSPINDSMVQNKSLQPDCEQKNPSQVELGISSPRDDERGFTVINVEGVQRDRQYLATQLPVSSTLPDFWNLVADKKIELIILLQCPDAQDSTKCDITPSEPGVHVLCQIEVEAKSIVEDGEYFTTKKFSLTDTSQDEPIAQPVTLLTCTAWADQVNETLPPVDSLVSLWMASEKVQRKEGPTLVICHDGITGCGLYLALSFLLERMCLESVCDVITAVRTIKRSEPNFVQSLNQFEYLYEAAKNYNQRFDTYANFL